MQRHDSTANPVVTKYLANPIWFGRSERFDGYHIPGL